MSHWPLSIETCLLFLLKPSASNSNLSETLNSNFYDIKIVTQLPFVDICLVYFYSNFYPFCAIFCFLTFLIEFIGMGLVNKIMQASGVQF